MDGMKPIGQAIPQVQQQTHKLKPNDSFDDDLDAPF